MIDSTLDTALKPARDGGIWDECRRKHSFSRDTTPGLSATLLDGPAAAEGDRRNSRRQGARRAAPLTRPALRPTLAPTTC